MADVQRVVELIFRGEDQTQAALNSALRGTEELNSKINNATQPMANAAQAALNFEAALIASGAAITGLAVKVAGDMDAAFREIATLIGVPSEELGAFRSEINDYALESSQSIESINNAIYNAISAGVDYTDSLAVVRQAEKLAVAGKGDLDSTLRVLVSSLNAYGAGMDEAESYSDALFTTVRQGQTTLPELSSSLAAVTTLAANSGVNFEELLSALASLTSVGMPTAEAVTGIRAAISAIIGPSNQAATLASDLGLEFNAAALESRGLSGVLGDVKEATGGNVEQMRVLFGSVEALSSVMALTGEASDSLATNLEAMENRAGATSAAYDEMAGAIRNANQRVVNAAQVMLAEIGTPLLTAYGDVADAIASIFATLAREVGGGTLQQFSNFLEGLAESMTVTFQSIAENLPEALASADLDPFLRGVENVRDAIAGLFDGADLTSSEGLAEVITTIGRGFEQFQGFVAGVIDVFPPFIEGLAGVLSKLSEVNPQVLEFAGAVSGWALVINTATGALTPLLAALVALGGAKGAATLAVGAIRGITLAMTGPLGLAAGFVLLMANLDKVNGALANFGGDNSIQSWANRMVTDVGAVNEAFERQEGRLRDVAISHAETLKDIGGMWAEFREMGGGPETDQDLADQAEALGAAFREAGMHYNAATGEVSKLSGEITKTIDVQDAAKESGKQWVKTIGEDGIPVFEQVGKVFTDEVTDPAVKGLKDATEETDKLRIALAQMASDEMIRAMELRVDVDIAQIEADTARIESAFESINTTISSTGDVISRLWGNMGDLSAYDQLGLEQQIRKENEAREKAFELQKRMTEAQIREMDARTKRMQQGDAMIKIEGDGLQPHLEAFMWEILRAIQTRVNADGEAYLLGAT